MADNSNPRCRCPRCTIRSLRGPAVVITLGILFLFLIVREIAVGPADIVRHTESVRTENRQLVVEERTR